MNNLELNYETIGTVISDLKTTLTGDIADINTIYNQLAGSFTESSGEEADALRELQEAEKKLMKTAKAVLTKLGESIEFAASEFQTMDTTGAQAMGTGAASNYK